MRGFNSAKQQKCCYSLRDGLLVSFIHSGQDTLDILTGRSSLHSKVVRIKFLTQEHNTMILARA